MLCNLDLMKMKLEDGKQYIKIKTYNLKNIEIRKQPKKEIYEDFIRPRDLDGRMELKDHWM